MSSQYTSKVILYQGVPFDNSYQHNISSLPIENKKAWLDANYTHQTFNNVMLPRIDTSTQKGVLRLEVIEDLAEDYNYCYIEDSKLNKRFCFVNGCNYVNDGKPETIMPKSVYDFNIELDVIMTYIITQRQYYPAPIERHHACHDFPDLRVAETLPMGELEIKDIKISDINTNDCYPVVAYTPKLNSDGKFANGFYMNQFMGIPNGAIFDVIDITRLSDAVNELSQSIEMPSQILAIYMVPKCFFADNIFDYGPVTPLSFSADYLRQRRWKVYDTAPTTKAKNKKLNYYPYNFAKLVNDRGDYSELRFEDWYDSWDNQGGFNKPKSILIEGNVTMPVSMRAVPYRYNGVPSGVLNPVDPSQFIQGLCYEKAVEISNYPLGSSSSDSYAQFVAQNGNSATAQYLGGLGVSAGSAAVGAALTAATTEVPPVAIIIGAITAFTAAAASSTISLMATKQAEKDKPDMTRGDIHNGNIEFQFKRKNFKIYRMGLKDEFLELIDSYFTRFGYSQGGIVKTPNDKARKYFTYIKTLGNCIKPIDVPGVYGERYRSMPNQNELAKINLIFMNGITLWNIEASDLTKDNIMKFDTLDNSNAY